MRSDFVFLYIFTEFQLTYVNIYVIVKTIKVGQSDDSKNKSDKRLMTKMANIKRMNKQLQKRFGGSVYACKERGCVVVSGQVASWEEVVLAGRLAVDKKHSRGVVNRVTMRGQDVPPMRVPKLRDEALEGKRPDVLIIGAGVTGCAIARELARYQLDVLLADKEYDVALHASSRNDGMVHPGIDLRKGTAKHHYNMRGNAMFDTLCDDLGVEFQRPGQYLCFSKNWAMPLLHAARLYWKWLGLPGVTVMGAKALFLKEPHLAKDIKAAVYFPSAGIVCPYGLTIALTENAVENGVRLSLNTAVLGMELREGGIQSVRTNRGTLYPKVVVNAAGTFSDEVARMADDQFYTIHPRRGTNSILDKKYTGKVANTIVAKFGSSSRSAHTKGGGIVRTVDGNLLIGPDAVETCERENFATHQESIRGTFAKHSRAIPALNENEIIACFSGVRAPTYEEDFVVSKGMHCKNMVHAAGIQSPGLTAAPAIGEAAARMAAELAFDGEPIRKQDFNPHRTPIVRTAQMSLQERAALIAKNSDYGEILCRCEEVSRGEVLDALRRPVPCTTVDGVRRRVRPGMGRCQGGFCGPLVVQAIAKELGLSPEQVQKSAEGSPIVMGPTKGGEAQ